MIPPSCKHIFKIIFKTKSKVEIHELKNLSKEGELRTLELISPLERELGGNSMIILGTLKKFHPENGGECCPVGRVGVRVVQFCPYFYGK